MNTVKTGRFLISILLSGALLTVLFGTEIHIYSIISEEYFYRRVNFREYDTDSDELMEWIKEHFEYFNEEGAQTGGENNEEYVLFEYMYSEAGFFSDLFLTKPFLVQGADISGLVLSNFISHERISRIRRRKLYRETFYFEDFTGIFWYHFRNRLPEELILDSERLHDIEERFFKYLHFFKGEDLKVEFESFRRNVMEDRELYELKDLLDLIQVFNGLKDFLLGTRIVYHLQFDFVPRSMDANTEIITRQTAAYVFTPLQCLFVPYDITIEYRP